MSTTIGTVTLTKNPVYPLNWWPVRFNQYTRETADGGHKTFDNGPTIISGVLNFRNVAKSEGDNLRTFLTGASARWQKTAFVITPPAATDIGKGAGFAITAFFDGGESLEANFELIPPGTYNIIFPYREKL